MIDARSGGRRSRLGQSGEALIESLVAIAILSTIVAATYGGMQVALSSSARTDHGATAGVLLRTAAETVQDLDFEYIELAGCGDNGTYPELATRKGFGSVSAAVGFWEPADDAKANQVVRFSEPGNPKTCPEEDPGLQLVQLSIETPEGTTETLQVTKRQP